MFPIAIATVVDGTNKADKKQLFDDFIVELMKKIGKEKVGFLGFDDSFDLAQKARESIQSHKKPIPSITLDTTNYQVGIPSVRFSYVPTGQGMTIRVLAFEETGLVFTKSDDINFLKHYGIFEEKEHHFFLDYYKIGKIIFCSFFLDEDTKIRYYNILILDITQKVKL
jgi:hypothetical protein